MGNRLRLLAWGGAATIAFLIMAVAFLQGGLLNHAKIVMIISPFAFIVILNMRKQWPILVFASLCTWNLSIPGYGLEKFHLVFIFFSVMSAIMFFGFAIKPFKIAKFIWLDRLILFLAIYFTVRFMHDRPGFVALGMEKGGFTNALYYATGGWFYFVARIIMASAELKRSQIKGVLAISFIVGILLFFVQGSGAGKSFYWARKLAGYPTWLVFSCILALLISADSSLKRWPFFYISSILMIGIGVISNFRARVFFFVAQILTASYFGKHMRQTIIVLSILGVLGLGSLLVLTNHVPAVVQRSLSLFMQTGGESRFGAMGWQDNFRWQLYIFGWQYIQANPLTGTGFGLDVGEALSILTVHGADARTRLHALSGAYHNTVLEIGVKHGFIIATIFVILFFAVPYRFFKFLITFSSENKDLRTWSIGLFLFCLPISMFALINGGEREFFLLMILYGMMSGLMINANQNSRAANEAAKP